MDVQKVMLSAGLFILRLSLIILVVIGIFRLGEYSYYFGYSLISDTSVDAPPGKDISMNLRSDMTVKEVAKLLERKGLIKDDTIFQIQLKLNDFEDKLMPGSYVLNTSMTAKEIMNVLSGEEEEDDEEEEE